MNRGVSKLKILLVIFVIIAIVGIAAYFGERAYLNSSTKEYHFDQQAQVYIYAKCMDFCPYKDYDLVSQTISLDQECIVSCVEQEENYNYERPFCPSFLQDYYYKKLQDNKITSTASDEFLDTFREEVIKTKNKEEYLSKYLPLLEENDDISKIDFIEPVYDEISFTLDKLSCQENGDIIATITVTKGTVSAFNFIISSEGSSKAVRKKLELEKGTHEIIITKNEYEFENVNRVELSYKTRSGTDSSIIAEASC